jgi:hypothetical protein
MRTRKSLEPMVLYYHSGNQTWFYTPDCIGCYWVDGETLTLIDALGSVDRVSLEVIEELED